MAEQRKKLELELNKPVILELLYNNAVIGNSQFGEFYLYGMKNGTGDVNFFAPPEVHEKLKDLKKGDKVQITKIAEQRGSKIIVSHDVQILTEPKQVEQSSASELPKDNYFELLYKCYQDALKLVELSPLIQPEKAAITLFIARSRLYGLNQGAVDGQ